MIRILKNTLFRGVAAIRGRRLLEGSVLLDPNLKAWGTYWGNILFSDSAIYGLCLK